MTPVLFLAAALWFTVDTTLATPSPSLTGIGLTLTGVPAYYFWRSRATPAVQTEP